jgi:DNA (cytosine-5)-methyltransferase 1
MQRSEADQVAGEVVDLFCGVGALSHGLKRAGFKIMAGYDTDRNCKYAYETNNDAQFLTRDVAKLTAEEIRSHFTGTLPTVLAGCAPCQPFSTYKHRYDEDPRWDLVNSFGKLAAEVQSDFVTMENVPSLLKYRNGELFDRFKNTLISAGYTVRWSIAKCEEFGVPQRRRRLVVVASRKGEIAELSATHPKPVPIANVIKGLPPLRAGETDANDPLHTSASLSPINVERIKASKPGGTWRDWPFELRARCHQKSTGQTYPGVYARMAWDEPSPTMTTQCFGFGNGRFGHPEQDRAISLREAALLQTFPANYQFLPAGVKISFTEVGRWIGNAVPVSLAEAVGRLILASNVGDIHGDQAEKAVPI